MHVALDTSALDPEFRAHAIRGTGRYVSELYTRLPAVFGKTEQLSDFQYSTIGKGGVLDSLVNYLPAGRTTIRHQLLYPLSLGRKMNSSADVLHFPVHADAPTWSTKPFVVTVLDLIPLIFKELYAPKKNDRRFQLARWLELQSIRNAEAVFAISENTAKDVHELLSVPRERIIVTPLGVDLSFFQKAPERDTLRERHKIPPDAPLILYVGGIDQRKNIAFMIEMFAEAVREQRAAGESLPILVMAGGISNDGQYPEFLQTITRLGVKERVVQAGYVSDEDLRAFYQEAEVFLYPSLYEGFGLPPLEAMASGTVVLCADTSSLPEVVGDAALLFSPEDRADATKKLVMILQCVDLRKHLARKGEERAKMFTWERTAELTAQGYRQVTSSPAVTREASRANDQNSSLGL